MEKDIQLDSVGMSFWHIRTRPSAFLQFVFISPIGQCHFSINAIDYPDSSVKFYICGEHGKYPAMNFRELDDIDLNINFKE